jgi:excisionase family DNA binding protein
MNAKPNEHTRQPAGAAVLTAQKAAEETGCRESEVLELIEEGKLAAINIGSGGRKHWRIPIEACKGIPKLLADRSRGVRRKAA